MGYYQQGDYATGGYGYGRGDPGFLSSLWKGIKKIAAPAIGFAVGGPAGLAAGLSLGGARTPPIAPPIAPQIPASQEYYTRLGPFTQRSMKITPVPQMSFRGGAPLRAPGTMPVAASATGCCPVGYHLDKKTGTRCVRNRRMNTANPRALRRAMRRVQGFEKLAKRTITFTKRTRLKKT